MFANKNNLRSELTANIGVLDTSISITSGEGILWENDMIACLEHYENDVCTKREIIKITAKNNDTFTVTRGFAVCIMNDATKQQGQGSQTFVAGDFLSLYLSKELWESITQNIGINETALQTMIGHITAPRTCINNNCLNWKQSIDSAYNTKYGGLAGFGDASDGDLVITEDTFLDASREYNFNNLTICANATLRFCGLGVPTINVRNNFKNYGTIDMRAPYLQARNTELTDHRLFKNDKISNKTDDLTQLGTEGGFYKGGSGAGGTASGSDASDGHGGNGGSGGAYDGINGGNGGTSGSFGTGGGGGFGMGKGGNGGTGACGGGNGGNGFYGGQGGNVTQRTRFNGGGGAGGLGVIRGGNAGGGAGSCDCTEMGNGGNAITNVYGLHLNARNIWNNLVTAKGGDGGNGGIYYRSGTSGGYAPSGGNGGNGANGGEIMVSYDTMHQQGTFDVSGGKGGIGGKIGFSSESYWRYEQPNGTDGTAGRVVFKNLNNPYIENFTLTNDEDNESILISWKDPQFKPSSTIQWKNTMIRVSTTNYPATITDGTLVVNETTKNQYESTPFSMSATDGVTYYFTAFAIAQDDTMIDVQTNSIEASFGRKPNENTLAYWKLESDYNDTMGNYNSNGQSNVSFETLASGKKVVKLTSTNGGISIPGYIFDQIGTGDFTISMRLKPVGKGNTGSGEALVFCQGKDRTPYYGPNIRYNRSGYTNGNFFFRFYGGNSPSGMYSVNDKNTFDHNAFHHICWTRINGVNTGYIDGVQVCQQTNNFQSSPTGNYGYIVSRYTANQSLTTGAMGSEIIFEKVGRTNVQKYFNKMKSLYGLS